MQFKLFDGEVFEGRTATDIVRSMMRMKMVKPGSRRQYRRSVAERAWSLYAAKLDPSSDDKLLQSMIDEQMAEQLA